QSLRSLPALRSEAKRLIAGIDRLIARVELMMQQTLEQIPAARQAAEHIATITGFGPLGSTCLGHSFTRLPYANSDAVVASSGLDPRPEDSGQKHGRRRLSKQGPAEQRRILFNCARSAARTKLWQPYYQAQLAKGLSATAATVILARKMLRVAFAVYKHGQPFNPSLLGSRA
ncbi:MAG: family transposase, partial [Betaproteobacteria bacterium]|nr:family transposase [Betaproteobacteria bacterium]